MEVVKTYVLSEKTLDKDIDKFIRDARNGAYQYDYKDGMEGLKIIKHYFKFIQKEFEDENYELCRICYKKLLLFMFETSTEYDYFNYEDIFGRTKLDFEKIVGNYFTCLTALCTPKELFEEYIEFIKAKQDCDFLATDRSIMTGLKEKDFKRFEELLIKEAAKVQEKSFEEKGCEVCDVLYFLLKLAKKNGEKAKYTELCKRFGPILGEEIDELIKEYNDEGDYDIIRL